MMNEFAIWVEGYMATGGGCGAQLVGYVDADTFADACDKLCSYQDIQRRFGEYNSERKTLWGCRLFDNAADARASFG